MVKKLNVDYFSEVTRGEFIIPMGDSLRDMYKENVSMGNSMKSLKFESIRPTMNTCAIT